MAPTTSSRPDLRGSAGGGKVSKVVISRLSLYLREVQHLLREGRETISSSHLGRRLGCGDAQVRKDLSHFGHLGQPGVGYRCAELANAIRHILGTHEPWAAVLVGTGNLGRALLGYRGFSQQGFRIMATFDTDAEIIGTRIAGRRVEPLPRLPEIVREHKIRLGVIAVPADAAQEVADLLVTSGVEGILNVAPVALALPENVSQVGVDLAIELEQLACSVLARQSGP